jgi:hypothetical protein
MWGGFDALVVDLNVLVACDVAHGVGFRVVDRARKSG